MNQHPAHPSFTPSADIVRRRRRKVALWLAPYVVAFIAFVWLRYGIKGHEKDWLMLGLLLAALLTPLVAAVVDGQKWTLQLLFIATWASFLLQSVTLFHSAGYRFRVFGEVDMGPIAIPFLGGFYAACTVIAVVAFNVAAWVRRRMS